MNNLLHSILVSAIVAYVFSSCSEAGYKTSTGGYHYAAVAAEHVDILFAPPNRPYKQIGIVSALGMNWSSDVAMDKKLQKCAADLGADTVILNGSAQTGPTGYASLAGGYGYLASYSKAQGIAIKYTN